MAKRGPSSLLKRVQAYTDKVTGANVTTVLTARKDRMLAQFNESAVIAYTLERDFKGWFANAAQPFADYDNFLAFARKTWRIVKKHVGLTQNGELTRQVNLFEDRGLDRAALNACVLAMFGVVTV